MQRQNLIWIFSYLQSNKIIAFFTIFILTASHNLLSACTELTRRETILEELQTKNSTCPTWILEYLVDHEYLLLPEAINTMIPETASIDQLYNFAFVIAENFNDLYFLRKLLEHDNLIPNQEFLQELKDNALLRTRVDCSIDRAQLMLEFGANIYAENREIFRLSLTSNDRLPFLKFLLDYVSAKESCKEQFTWLEELLTHAKTHDAITPVISDYLTQYVQELSAKVKQLTQELSALAFEGNLFEEKFVALVRKGADVQDSLAVFAANCCVNINKLEDIISAEKIIRVIKVFLAHGAKIYSEDHNLDFRLLAVAIYTKNVTLLQLLLANGAQLTSMWHKISNGHLPIPTTDILAIFLTHGAIANREIVDNAAALGLTDHLQLLLDSDIDFQPDLDGAISYGQILALQILLNRTKEEKAVPYKKDTILFHIQIREFRLLDNEYAGFSYPNVPEVISELKQYLAWLDQKNL